MCIRHSRDSASFDLSPGDCEDVYLRMSYLPPTGDVWVHVMWKESVSQSYPLAWSFGACPILIITRCYKHFVPKSPGHSSIYFISLVHPLAHPPATQHPAPKV